MLGFGQDGLHRRVIRIFFCNLADVFQQLDRFLAVDAALGNDLQRQNLVMPLAHFAHGNRPGFQFVGVDGEVIHPLGALIFVQLIFELVQIAESCLCSVQRFLPFGQCDQIRPHLPLTFLIECEVMIQQPAAAIECVITLPAIFGVKFAVEQFAH